MEICGCLLGNEGKTVPEVSQYVGEHLLPTYAQILLNINDKKDYELIDSVCFLCDCLEKGDDNLFNKI
jgi:hypothetical protein